MCIAATFLPYACTKLPHSFCLVLASLQLPFRETGCLPHLISLFVYRSSAHLIGVEVRELALGRTSTKVNSIADSVTEMKSCCLPLHDQVGSGNPPTHHIHTSILEGTVLLEIKHRAHNPMTSRFNRSFTALEIGAVISLGKRDPAGSPASYSGLGLLDPLDMRIMYPYPDMDILDI